MISDADEVLSLEHIEYLHLNDSKHPLGSEKDEHQHIGEGAIGKAGFQNFINHEALRDLPIVLETPKDDKGFAWNIDKTKELRN